MLTSKMKQDKISMLQKTAIELYRKGKTLREVGEILNRSHTWVWLSVKEKTETSIQGKNSVNTQKKFERFNAMSLRRYPGEKITFEDWVEYTKDWPSMCFCCGDKDPIDGFSIDHIKCSALGGRHELDNLQLLCLRCNSRKGNRYWDFRKNLGMFTRSIDKDLTE